MKATAAAMATLTLLLAGFGLPLGQAADTSVSVTNVAPAVVSVTLPGSSINPTSGSATSVSTTIVIEDLNGYNDISSVTLEILKPDGSTSHVAASAATLSTGAATQATYTKSFSMNFHDDPALSTSTYKVKVVATDVSGATGTNAASLAIFNYAELAAVNLNVSTLSFGSDLTPNSASGTAQLGLQNYGNVQIDAQVSGTDLTNSSKSATIPVANMAYSTASDMSGSSALSGSAATLSAFDLAKGASSSKTTYWRLTVPSGSDQYIPSGTYTGTLTVGAVKG